MQSTHRCKPSPSTSGRPAVNCPGIREGQGPTRLLPSGALERRFPSAGQCEPAPSRMSWTAWAVVQTVLAMKRKFAVAAS